MAVFLKPDATTTIKSLNLKIFKYFLINHNPNNIDLPSKRTKPIVGITLHNTDWINTSPETTCAEQYTRATVNGNMRTVRVHYYVDDKGAWFNLPWDYQSWHAGSKHPEANGSLAGNAQTISIECIMDGSGKEYDRTSRDNAAKLIAYLLYTHKLTIDNLYTHNYWVNVRKGLKGTTDYLNMTNDNYKNCPIFIRPQWLEFKQLVVKYLDIITKANNSSNTTTNSTTNQTDKSTLYRVQIGAFSLKANAEAYRKKAVNAGFTQAYIVTSIVNNKKFYRVQIGAFSKKANALAYQAKAKQLGFSQTIIVTN